MYLSEIYIFFVLILGQVEEAKLKEAQLRNELKNHNIEISTAQQVQFPSIYLLSIYFLSTFYSTVFRKHAYFIKTAVSIFVVGDKDIDASLSSHLLDSKGANDMLFFKKLWL